MYRNLTQATESLELIMAGMDEYQGSTREEYFEWIRKWKHSYKGLTRVIRELKRCRKENKYEYAKKEEGKNSISKNRTVIGDNSLYDPDAQTYLEYRFRPAARKLMILREKAKQRGIECRESEKKAA